MALGMTARVAIDGRIATVTLDDPGRRNALGLAMFDALDEALRDLADRGDVRVVLLRGSGRSFCAGFDLAAAVEDPPLMGRFIDRLSVLLRTLRRLPPVVVASVQGAAVAGGCAILSACDLVVVARSAKIGYPVHRLGISPAVTIATLQQALPAGAARSLLLGGELIDGVEAHRIGLVSHLSRDDQTVELDATALCTTIGGHGPEALRVTKAWLNELDGSGDDEAFARPAAATADLARGDEAAAALRAFWESRAGRSGWI